MFVCCEFCVLSGRGLFDEMITHPEVSYRLWCVVVCDLETSRMRRLWPALGRSATKKSCTVVVLTCFVLCESYVWVGFVLCGCFGDMYICIYCDLYCLYCVFVLFLLCCCIVSFMYIYSYLFCLYYCKDYCHRVKTQLQLIIIIIIIIIIINKNQEKKRKHAQ